MIKKLLLSATFVMGLIGCDEKLEDLVVYSDINNDGKRDIVHLRRSEGLSCDKEFDDHTKSPPGIYVLLGLGNSLRGYPYYNLCEIPIYDLSHEIDISKAWIEVNDYNKDGKKEIIYYPENKGKDTLMFSKHREDCSSEWDMTPVKTP